MKMHVLQGILPVLIIGMLLTTACAGVQINVREAPKAHSLSLALNKAVQEHPQVAIVGIDFDPPLQLLERSRAQGITLLVAIENRSDTPIKDARIRAHLNVGDGRPLVIQRVGLLSELPPHTVVVYRFPRLRNIPIRYRYSLDITVETADGQRILSTRTYNIDVDRSRK